MKKKPKRLKAIAADRHRKMLAELPEAMEKRHNNIYHRNQMLSATQAYNLNIERNRVKSHLSDFPFGPPTSRCRAAHGRLGKEDTQIGCTWPSIKLRLIENDSTLDKETNV